MHSHPQLSPESRHSVTASSEGDVTVCRTPPGTSEAGDGPAVGVSGVTWALRCRAPTACQGPGQKRRNRKLQTKRKRDFRFCKRKDILSVTEYGFLKVREGFLAFFSQG